MKAIGALEATINSIAEESRRERVQIVNQVHVFGDELEKIKSWVSEYNIRKDERSKMKNEKSATIKNVEKMSVKTNVWNDPKITAAVIGFLTVATGYLIYLQQQGA